MQGARSQAARSQTWSQGPREARPATLPPETVSPVGEGCFCLPLGVLSGVESRGGGVTDRGEAAPLQPHYGLVQRLSLSS